MNDHANRTKDWFLGESTRDRVRGYLQNTQAKALHALLECQSQSGLTGSLAEIGVYFGKTLIGLARAAGPDERVLGVDPLVIGGADLLPELRRNLTENLNKDEISRLEIKRALSTQINPLDWMRSLRQPARFIHLDGHHARETMLHDLQLASSWLQKGAVVVIDDFLNELHPDLTSGILDGLEAHPQLEPVAVIPRMGHIEEGGSKLVCVTRGDAGLYRETLDRALSDHLRPSADRMLGREVRVYRSTLPATAVASRQPAQSDAKPLPVVFALHDSSGSYWLNTAVAITSLAEHVTRPVNVCILHDATLHDLAKQRLTQIGRDMRVQITLIPVEIPVELQGDILRHFSPASAFRLLIPKIFADDELVIYLDSDLVVNGVDIFELASAAPSDAAISAVKDPNIAAAASHAKELERMGLDADAYFNSGVLALRPALLPENLLERFITFVADNPTAIHPDQDFLNSHFKNNAYLLEDRFNFQLSLYKQSLLQNLEHYRGKILHYAGKIKPLDGYLSTGLIPFFVHAHRVPEISGGLLYSPSRYLLPDAKNPHAVRAQKILDRPQAT